VTSTIDAAGGAVQTTLGTPLERLLQRLHETYRDVDEGEVADYIPELSKADPRWFGISIVSLDGNEYAVGDTAVPFTIQSISKPFVYGLALEDHGEESVLSKVGVEPSGDAFNAISLDPGTGVPSNPMINAGAITIAGMIAPGEAGALARLQEMFGRYTGRVVDIDEAVYRSESETGHRNRAIGHLLRNFDIISGDPEAALDLYFQQCSISVTCRDLAVMAACLANGGVNPVTGERAVERRHVESILSVMGSCGMYDYAGEWIYRVGMPAKSGVSGGVMAVLPGQMGIGVFSPRLDVRGNSVRGVRVCGDLSEAHGLHMLSVPNLARAAVRVSYDATSVRSKRQRGPQATEALSRLGGRIRVYELQGDLVFSAVESFSRQLLPALASCDLLVIDFKHTGRIGDGGLAMMLDLLPNLRDLDKKVALSGTAQLREPAASAEALAGDQQRLRLFPDRDLAMEWCEDQLLAEAAKPVEDHRVPIDDNDLCVGLAGPTVAKLESLSVTVQFREGETLVRAGDAGDSVYLLLRGSVSVTIDLPGGGSARVSTLSAGMVFGEMAMLGEQVRSANVRADSDVECAVLAVDDLVRLGEDDPTMRATLYENIARKLAANLRRANAEVRALSG
jgi:glutaminase